MAGKTSKKPRLIVFDLDFTLWPFWVDTHVTAPFKKRSCGGVFDAHGQQVPHYEEVPAILKSLKEQGYTIAIASRTSCIKEAEDLLKLFGWNQYITYKEIYPGSKVTHFNKFHHQSGIPYSDMIFFDDEYRNVKDTSKLGVHAVLVETGVSLLIVRKALSSFARS